MKKYKGKLKKGDRVRGFHSFGYKKNITRDWFTGVVVKIIGKGRVLINRDDHVSSTWVAIKKQDGSWGANVDTGILTLESKEQLALYNLKQ